MHGLLRANTGINIIPILSTCWLINDGAIISFVLFLLRLSRLCNDFFLHTKHKATEWRTGDYAVIRCRNPTARGLIRLSHRAITKQHNMAR